MFLLLFFFGFFIHISSSADEKLQKFRVKPTNTTAKIGDDVIMVCEVDNRRGSVQWTKDGFFLGYNATIPGNPRYTFDKNELSGTFNLKIQNTSIMDDGLFECQVSPSPPPHKQKILRASAILYVISAPTGIELVNHKNNSMIAAVENKILVLQCLIKKSRPPASALWYKGKSKLKSGIETQIKKCESVKENVTLCDVTSTLSIVPNSDDDLANYTCIAQHEALDKSLLSSTVQLTLFYPPGMPYIEGYNDAINEGDTIDLMCRSRGGNPLAQLIWYKNKEQIQTIYRTVQKVSENIYKLKAEANDNNNTYTCQANSAAVISPLTASVTVTVYFGPSSVSISGKNEGNAGNVVKISCTSSSSNPAASVSWTVNNEASSNFTIKHNPGANGGFITLSELSVLIPHGQKQLRIICYAMNKHTSKSSFSDHTISVFYPPGRPIITGYDKDSYIEAKTTQRILCISSGGNPLASLTWYRNDNKITSIFKKVDDSTVSAEITIVPNATDNGAKYKCEAKNPSSDMPLSESMTLRVYFAPSEATVKTEPKDLKDGVTSKLTCTSTSSNPKAELSWFRDGIAISDGIVSSSSKDGLHGGKITTSELLLNITWKMDTSMITCQALNKALQRAVHVGIELNVKYKPKIEELNETVFTFNEGDRLSVAISAQANPKKMTYMWTRNDLPISSGVSGTFLEIAKISRNDAGHYTCEVTNSQGSDFVNFDVIVKYGAEITNITKTLLVPEGSDAELLCYVSGYPFESEYVKWMRNGSINQIFDTFQTTFFNNTSHLLFKNVTRKDTGTFLCIVDNHIARSYKSSFLIVEHEPLMENNEKMVVQAAKYGESTKLICTASGAPKLTFSWYKNGNKINDDGNKYTERFKKLTELQYKSILVIEQVTSLDYGYYECIASNKHGNSTSIFKLTVTSKPDTPSNLTLINLTHNSVTLSWILDFDGGEATSFQIRYKAIEPLIGHYRYEDVSNKTITRIYGLSSDVTYSFTVRASNKLGISPFSEVLNITTLPAEDGKPLMDTLIEYEEVVLLFAFLFIIFLIIFNICLVIKYIHCQKTKKSHVDPQLETTLEYNNPKSYSAMNKIEEKDEYSSFDSNFASLQYERPRSRRGYVETDGTIIKTGSLPHPRYSKYVADSSNAPLRSTMCRTKYDNMFTNVRNDVYYNGENYSIRTHDPSIHPDLLTLSRRRHFRI